MPPKKGKSVGGARRSASGRPAASQKKSASSRAASKAAANKVVKKSVTKKTPTAAAKKPAAKSPKAKAAVSKTATKATRPKSAAKPAPSKSTGAKKTSSKRTPAKKPPAKKTPAKKTPAKKTVSNEEEHVEEAVAGRRRRCPRSRAPDSSSSCWVSSSSGERGRDVDDDLCVSRLLDDPISLLPVQIFKLLSSLTIRFAATARSWDLNRSCRVSMRCAMSTHATRATHTRGEGDSQPFTRRLYAGPPPSFVPFRAQAPDQGCVLARSHEECGDQAEQPCTSRSRVLRNSLSLCASSALLPAMPALAGGVQPNASDPSRFREARMVMRLLALRGSVPQHYISDFRTGPGGVRHRGHFVQTLAVGSLARARRVQEE